MRESQKHYVSFKKSRTKEYYLFFYAHDVEQRTKLTYGDRNQNSSSLLRNEQKG